MAFNWKAVLYMWLHWSFLVMIFNRQCWFVTVKILRNLRRLFALLTVFSAEEDHHADVVNAISSQMSSLGASWDSDSDLQNINEQQLHSSLKINQRKNILLCVRCVHILPSNWAVKQSYNCVHWKCKLL